MNFYISGYWQIQLTYHVWNLWSLKKGTKTCVVPKIIFQNWKRSTLRPTLHGSAQDTPEVKHVAHDLGGQAHVAREPHGETYVSPVNPF